MGLINPAGLFLATPLPSVAWLSEAALGDDPSATRTFSAFAIGAAHGKRRIHVFGHANQDDNSINVASATIGGVSATIHFNFAGNTTYFMFSALVPTGTTANIAITFNTDVDGLGISVYRSVNLKNTAVFDSDSASGGKSSGPSLTIDIAHEGFVLAATTGLNFTAGVTRDDTGFLDVGSAQHLAAQTNRTISNGTNAAFLFAASFR